MIFKRSYFSHLPVAIFFLLLSAVLGEMSQLGSHIHQVFSELPLLLVIYYLLFKMQPDSRRFIAKVAIATSPIVILYLAYDYYFITFNTVFKFHYLANLGELVQVLNTWQMIGFLAIVLLPLVMIVISISVKKIRWFFAFIALVLALSLWVVSFPKSFISYVQAIYPGNFYEYSLVMDNGRFVATFYTESKRRVALEQLSLATYAKNDQRSEEIVLTSLKKKDIYVVVLESFINRQDFNNLRLTQIEGTEIANLPFSKSRSPVFGGGTPRAEFEVLCGVPSFATFGSSEFDLLTNGPISCLPEILNQNGYLTIGTNPYKPVYFNEANAYKNLGFKDINFLKPFVNGAKTYLDLEMPKAGYPFDGDVLSLNMDYVRKAKKSEPEKSIFSYIMTIYGHSPFHVSEKEGVPYKMSETISPFLARAINMSAQTEIALNNYIEQIKEISPENIILIIGDHLPPMPMGFADYQKAGYLNGSDSEFYYTPRIFMVDGVHQLEAEILNHYDFFYEILNELQAGQLCKQQNCRPEKESLIELYNSMMFKSIH